MWCLACEQFCREVVCRGCRSACEPAPDVASLGGIVVRPAYVHQGPPRSLVMKLKYQGVEGVAEFFASALVSRLPQGVRCLVPVPRVTVRAVKYGVDPARLLAEALSKRTGVPVATVLRPPIWAPRSAGRARLERSEKRFSLRTEVEGWVLVDDVLTTGSTLAAAALGLRCPGLGAVTATASL